MVIKRLAPGEPGGSEAPASRKKRRSKVPADAAGQGESPTEGKTKKERRRLADTLPDSAEQVPGWFGENYAAVLQKLSPLELYPTGNRFRETDFVLDEKNVVFSVDNIPKLIKRKRNPQIRCLVVCASALRACDLRKPLAALKRPVAKLFAKHLKLKEQIEYLSNSNTTLGIGTPNRLLKLAQAKALDGIFSDSKNALILIDLHKDVKNYSLLNMPVVSQDSFELLRLLFASKPSDARPRVAFCV